MLEGDVSYLIRIIQGAVLLALGWSLATAKHRALSNLAPRRSQHGTKLTCLKMILFYLSTILRWPLAYSHYGFRNPGKKQSREVEPYIYRYLTLVSQVLSSKDGKEVPNPQLWRRWR